MAKDIDLDDFDLDDDLDFEFNGPAAAPAIPPKSRQPLDVAMSVGGGAINQILGSEQRRKLILGSLPEEYRAATDSYDSLSSEARDVYYEAKEQLGKTKQEVKRATREALPLLKPFMPKSLHERLKKATTQEPNYRNEVDVQQSQIDAAMNSVFSARAAENRQEAQDAITDRAEAEVKEAARDVRSKNIMDIQLGTAKDVRELVAYQNGPGTEYRRKMLELGFRQLFALQDHLKLSTETSEKLIPALDAIVKNTALPDYAKEEFSEVTAAMIKRKLIEGMSASNFSRNYTRLLGSSVKARIQEFLGGVNDTVSEIGGMAGMMNSMQEDSDSPEGDPALKRYQTMKSGAGKAGAMFASKYITPYVKKGQSKLREMGENHEGVAGFGRNAAYYLGNLGEVANTYAQNPYYEGREKGILGSLFKFLGEYGPQFSGETAHIDERNVEMLAKGGKITNRFVLTVEELIPEQLARIDQSIRGIYSENAPLRQYDFSTRKFVDVRDVARKVRAEMDDPYTKETVSRYSDDIIKTLFGDEKLDPKDLEILKQTIDDKARNATKFDIFDLATSQDAYGSQSNADNYDLQDKFSDLAADKAKAEQLNLEVAEKLRRMRSAFGQTQSKINFLEQRYGGAALHRSGVFTERDGRLVANEKLFETFSDFNDDDYAFGDDVPKSRLAGIDAGISAFGARAAPPRSQRGQNFGNLNPDVFANGIRQGLMMKSGESLESIVRAVTSSNRPPEEKREDLMPLIKAIHETLVESNVAPRVDEILDAIDAINVNIHQDAPEGVVSRTARNAKSMFSKLKDNILEKSRKHRRRGRAIWKWGTRKVGAFQPVKRVKDFLEATVTGVKSFTGAVLGNRDIVDEEGNVILSAKGIKLGKYYTKEGKQIKSIKDIVGGIYDETGNAIVSEEEMTKKIGQLRYMSETGWKKLSVDLPGWVGGKIRDTATMFHRGHKWIRNNIIGGAKNILREATTSVDIYASIDPEPREPRLRHHLMVKGFYVDGNTGKPIRGIDDITGEVITKHKEMIISEAELANPAFKLIDREGNELKGKWQKAGERLGKLGSFAWRMAKKPFEWGKKGLDFVGDLLGTGKDWLKGKFPGFGGLKGKGAQDTLERIYQLLDERMPGGSGKKGADDTPKGEFEKVDDVDGDGVRDNSWQSWKKKWAERRAETKAKQDAARKEKLEKDGKKPEGDGWLARALGGVGTMLSMGKDFAMSALSIFGGGFKAILMGAWEAVAAKIATSGILKSIGGVLSTAKTATGAAIGSAATKAGTVIRGAGSAIGWAGRATVMGLLRWAGTAVIGMVSSPLAIAATIGYVAYKIATRKKAEPLDKYRFAQYGVQEFDREDKEDIPKLRYLEDSLLRYTSFNKEGVASIRGVNEAVTHRIAEGFGINPDDKDLLKRWNNWLFGRFLPIYLIWVSRARQHAPTLSMKDIADKSKNHPIIQKKIFDSAMLNETHPVFKVLEGPFDDPQMLTGEEVVSIGNDVRDDLDTMVKFTATTSEDRKKLEAGNADRDLSGKALLTGDANNREERKVDWKVASDAAADDKSRRMDENMRKGSEQVFGVSTIVNGRPISKDIDALTAIRLRAYGLYKFDVSRIAMLYKIEDLITPNMTKEGGKWVFKGNLDGITEEVVSILGVYFRDKTAVANAQNWFKVRFLPIYLQYFNLVKQHIPNGNPFDLFMTSKTAELYDVGVGLVGAKIVYGGKSVSVWQVDLTPWKTKNDYDATAIGKAVADNLRFLEEQRKAMIMREQAKAEGKGVKATAAPIRGKNKNIDWRANKDAGPSVASQRDAAMAGADISNLMNNGPTSNEVANLDTSGFDMETGLYNGVEEGSGGYADLKQYRGKDRATMAKLVAHAAKLTGMDPGEMLTIAMMESSLEADAGAKTSSAKGLFQFLVGGKWDTWGEVKRKWGNKYGIPSQASAFDPAANALLGGEFLKEGAAQASKALGRRANPVDMYVMHMMGSGDGPKFLSNLTRNPNANASEVMTKAAAANPGVFKDKQGRQRSFAQVYQSFIDRARTNQAHVKRYLGMSQAEQPKEKVALPGTDTKVSVPPAIAKEVGDKGGPDVADPNAATTASVAKAGSDAAKSVRLSTADMPMPIGGADKPTSEKEVSDKAKQVAKKNATAGATAAEIRDSSARIAADIDLEKHRQVVRSSDTATTVAENKAVESGEVKELMREQVRRLISIDKNIIDIRNAVTNPPAANSQPMPQGKNGPVPARAAAASPTVVHAAVPINMSRG